MNMQQAKKIAALAGLVVLETPKERRQFRYTAYVRYDLIDQIEDALREAGYDMAAARKRMEENRKEATQ